MTSAALAELLVRADAGYWGTAPGEGALDVRVIRNGDVRADGTIRWEQLPLRSLTVKEADRAAVEQGDIVLTTSGDCGQAAFIDRTLPDGLCVTNFVRALRPRRDRVEPRFLFWVLNSHWFRRALRPFIRGTTMKNLSFAAAAAEIQVPLPSLECQQRLSGLLDRADALRTTRAESLRMFDLLIRSVFIDMFGDPALGHGPRIALREVAELITGNTPSRQVPEHFGTAIEWLKSDNILLSGEVTTATEGLSDLGRRKGREAPPGSTLVVCIAGSPSSIGRAGLLDRPAAFNQQINAVVPRDELLPEFLFHQLQLGQRLVQRASTNSMKGMVSKSALGDVRIAVPPLADQQRFVDFVKRWGGVRRTAFRSGHELEELFLSLHGRALRGQL